MNKDDRSFLVYLFVLIVLLLGLSVLTAFLVANAEFTLDSKVIMQLGMYCWGAHMISTFVSQRDYSPGASSFTLKADEPNDSIYRVFYLVFGSVMVMMTLISFIHQL